MLTPVSGHGESSGSKSMMVARREWLRAGASATLMTNAWSIAETYSSRRASGRGAPAQPPPCRPAPAVPPSPPSCRRAPMCPGAGQCAHARWPGAQHMVRTRLAAAGYAAVERDDRAGQVGARAGCEHQRQADDVIGPADAPQRHHLLDLVAALRLVEHERRHPALKRAGRDRVDGDVLACEALGEMAREHVHGGLAGTVAVVLHHGRAQAVDRADVDHPGGI